MSTTTKTYDAKIAHTIRSLAAYACGMRMIVAVIDDITKYDLDPDGMYRKDWEKGKEEGKAKVHNTYFKMATSGKSWAATKHFLATQCNIVEPKEVVIETAKPDLSHLTTAQLAQIINIANGEEGNQTSMAS